jgi:hypothetical protein
MHVPIDRWIQISARKVGNCQQLDTQLGCNLSLASDVRTINL